MMDNSLCAWARDRLPLWAGPTARADVPRGPTAPGPETEAEAEAAIQAEAERETDGLDEHDRALLERHLAACPACAAHRASLDRALAALALAADDWPLAPDAPSLWPDLERRIAARSRSRTRTQTDSNSNAGAHADGHARAGDGAARPSFPTRANGRAPRDWRGRIQAFLDLDRPLRLTWTRDALAESFARLRARQGPRAKVVPDANARVQLGNAGPGWAWWSAGLAAGALLLALFALPAAHRARTLKGPGTTYVNAIPNANANATVNGPAARQGRSPAVLQASRGGRRGVRDGRARPRRNPQRPPDGPGRRRHWTHGSFDGSAADADTNAVVHAGRDRDWDQDRAIVATETAAVSDPWRPSSDAPDRSSPAPGLNELARADVPARDATGFPNATSNANAPGPSLTAGREAEAVPNLEIETAPATGPSKSSAAARSTPRWNYDLEHGFPMSNDDDDDAKPVY